MFGHLLNTLRYRLDAEEKEWRSYNSLRQELRPDWLTGWVLRHAEHPFRLGIAMALLVTVASLVTGVLKPERWVVYHVSTTWLPDPGVYFIAVWSVQAAVVALVYPIVIGFVTLLLERRGSAKAALHIYLHYSAAQLAGFSAMLLVAEMALQSLGLLYAHMEAVAFWLAIDTIWFILNIVLTVFFLKHTFDFIRPVPRFSIVRRYTIGVAWPREVRYYLAKHIFRTAVACNLLPGPAFGEAPAGQPSVLMGYAGAGFGEARVTYNVPRRLRMTDVSFRVLSLVTRSWLKEAAPRTALPTPARSRRNRDPVIVFPLEPFAPCNGEVTLCRLEGNTKLSNLQRMLVSLSFRFGSGRDDIVELSVSDILSEAQAEALSAVRSAEPEAFKQSIERFIGLYVSLVDASRVKDTSGGETSLLLMFGGRQVFERRLFEGWNVHILDMFDSACARLGRGEDYVSFLTHLPNRLFSRTSRHAPAEIQKYFIALGPILLRRVEAWWTNSVEEQGEVEHGPCAPATLRSPFFGIHDQVVREFVGSWESLKNDHIPPARDERSNWTDVQRAALGLESHLSQTLVLLLDCVLRGDRNAAEWLGDVLIKWFAELEFRLGDSRHYFLRDPPMFTIELLSDPWEEVKKRLEVESYGGADSLKPIAILSSCIRNLWVDVCCIALYVLALWNRECECNKSLAARVFTSVRHGRALRKGGEGAGGFTVPYRDANELLIAVLRQNFADHRYRSRLDGYVELVASLSETRIVSGRMYSSFGSNDLDSLRDGQLITLLLANQERWRSEGEIEEILTSWSGAENEKVRGLSDMLGQWKTRLGEESFSELRASYECLRQQGAEGGELDDAKIWFSSHIDRLLERAEGVHLEALAAAEPSRRRLAEIAHAASSKAFTPESGGFPLSLFQTTMTVAEQLDQRTLVINGVKKGELTEPPMSVVAANEEEWFADTMRLQVGAAIFRHVVTQLAPAQVDAGSPESYLTRVKQFDAELRATGLTPILILENPTLPNWVWEWANPPWDKRTSDAGVFRVKRDENRKGEGYLWNFDSIPVYNGPIQQGSSVLLAKESFEQIRFTRAQGSEYVDVQARKVPEHPDLVDLALTWYVEIRVRKLPALLLFYGEKGTRDDV